MNFQHLQAQSPDAQPVQTPASASMPQAPPVTVTTPASTDTTKPKHRFSVAEIWRLFKPNANISKSTFLIMVAVQAVVMLALWFSNSLALIPNPLEIVKALGRLISEEDLLTDLFTSLSVSLQAMAITVVLSLIISYATVLPFFRPLAFLVSKLRYLTLVGLTFVFMLLTSDGHALKVSLLVFGMTVFFVTSMVSVMLTIPKYEFNHARTLRFSEWQVVWEVIIVGRFDAVFEVIRQNFAISWMMLTLVEGISRADGGVGAVLINQNKHLHLDSVFAIQFLILFVGIGQDYLFGVIKNIACPYANLTFERK